jgi:Tol biopolymer transport system component
VAAEHIHEQRVGAYAGVQLFPGPLFFGPFEIGDLWDVSNTGSELLVAETDEFGSDGPVWVVPLPAGAPHRIGNISAHAGCWTPDGMRLAYANGNELYIARADGGKAHKLASTPGIPRVLRFSPDGTRLRFHIYDTEQMTLSLWEVKSDGSGLHPLLPGWNTPAYECCGNWTRDAKYYLFESRRGSAQDIWALIESHSMLRNSPNLPARLTTGPLAFGEPVPSADGKKVFVVGDQNLVELSRYDAKTKTLSPFFGGISAGPLDISRDGKWAAYVADPEGTLWRSRVDGSERIQLTFPPIRAYEPRFSPDGTQIVFTDVQRGEPWKIMLVPAGGGVSQEVAPNDKLHQSDPTWTADGNTIVFGQSRGFDAKQEAVYTIDLKTHQVSKLPGSDGISSPRGSPDGRYIAAQRYLDPEAQMLYDSSAGKWAVLTEGEWGYQEWTRDGRYLYAQDSNHNLFRIKIATRKLQKVLDLKDVPVRMYRRSSIDDLFAYWTGVAADGSPILMRDKSTQDIYAIDVQLP